MNAVKPFDYYLDTCAALIAAHWFATWNGGRVEVLHRYIERRNHKFFGGWEMVEKIKRIRVVTGSARDGSIRAVRVFYNS